MRIAALMALALVGCASGPDPAVKAQAQATVPSCASPRECEVKWAAAREWVQRTSPFKFQIMQPDMLETFNPPSGSPELAARITKVPLQDGTYRITASLWCSNPYGCSIEPWSAVLQFNDAVTASWSR